MSNNLDKYYDSIQEQTDCKITDILFGKRYEISETCKFDRIEIEAGLEISILDLGDKREMLLTNESYDDDYIEIGYCYKGKCNMAMLPGKENHCIYAGDLFAYRFENKFEDFIINYDNYKSISIIISPKVIFQATNPEWGKKIINDWQNQMNDCFKNEFLKIEKANFNFIQLAKQIEKIDISTIKGFLNLKSKVIELIYEILEFFSLKRRGPVNGSLELLEKVKDSLNDYLLNPPSLEELSNQFNISIYHLQKVFKELEGITIFQYIQKKRMEKATSMLLESKLSILEVANECGYDNPSKFSNVFKKHYLITPLKYRKKITNT